MDKIKELWDTKDKEVLMKYKYLIMQDLELDKLSVMAKEDKEILGYMKELESLNNDKKFREFITYEEDINMQMNSERKEGYDAGEAHGISIGKEEGERLKTISIARNMLNLNIDLKIISQSTGLSIEEIEKIKF